VPPVLPVELEPAEPLPDIVPDPVEVPVPGDGVSTPPVEEVEPPVVEFPEVVVSGDAALVDPVLLEPSTVPGFDEPVVVPTEVPVPGEAVSTPPVVEPVPVLVPVPAPGVCTPPVVLVLLVPLPEVVPVPGLPVVTFPVLGLPEVVIVVDGTVLAGPVDEVVPAPVETPPEGTTTVVLEVEP
jgi:hypothetical protein